jgi:hypothetical protein
MNWQPQGFMHRPLVLALQADAHVHNYGAASTSKSTVLLVRPQQQQC